MDKTILIAALARDCEKNLERNLLRIEELRSNFSNSYVLIIENDSKDHTKNILIKYKKTHHNVKLISKDYYGLYPIKDYPKSTIQGKGCTRIARMAYFRNMILEYSKQYNIYDYLVTIDIDVFSFSADEIINAICNAPAHWGALFANGQIYRKTNKGLKPIPLQHDIYAYFKCGEKLEKIGIHYLNENYLLIRSYLANMLLSKRPYIDVLSAYGGLGIYKRECLVGNSYEVFIPTNWAKYNACICEHAPFHKKIIDNGYRCLLVRDLHVIYDIVDKKGIKGFLLNHFPIIYSYISRFA